jgi:hypothetical protein
MITITTGTHLELTRENLFIKHCIVVASQDNSGLHGAVSEHFGRCAYFALTEVTQDQITSIRVVDNPYVRQPAPGQVPVT